MSNGAKALLYNQIERSKHMPVQAVFPDFNLVELELSVKVHFKVRWCAVANTTYKSTLQSDNTKSVNWTNLISLGYFKGKCQNIKLH